MEYDTWCCAMSYWGKWNLFVMDLNNVIPVVKTLIVELMIGKILIIILFGT
ncbi:hypothetical protein RHMOL_Rhmol13G0251900 [Rhododendron molle]|uniref:Uncharacterized protein n=1 Tax=Rhododendron molle TaxID=49168 RepID=A0ACC0LAY2_RHOML|nr:hypothetical protein RHMOL_Rhmol13G0251900 [Rhododendron molle]